MEVTLMRNQSRILLIAKYLTDQTDAEHEVSSRDIKNMLEQNGLPAPDSRTIDTDIDLLIAAGYDISRKHMNGQAMQYSIIDRSLDTVELKILIDAIAASQFIGVEKSKRIISQLAAMASVSDRPYLEEEINQVRSIKKAVGGTMVAADTILHAIVAQKKIQFQMIDYRVPDKARFAHKGGKVYSVSPYATIWSNDRYYLVCYDDDRNSVITPRMDHIRKVRVLDEPIKPKPADFDIGYYYTSSYKMYGGPEMEVTIECENDLLGKFIDRFGMEFDCIPVTDHTFQATVKTCVGNTFFGWLFQYAGRMHLRGPDAAVELYQEQLAKAQTQYMERREE